MSEHPAVTDFSSKSHNPVVALIIFSFVLATCSCSMSKNSERSTAKPEAAPAVATNDATGDKRASFAPVFLSNLELFLTAAKVSPEKIALTLSKIKFKRLGLAGTDAQFEPVMTSSVAAVSSTLSMSEGTASIVVYAVAASTATEMQITSTFDKARSTGEFSISGPAGCDVACLPYLAERIREVLESPGDETDGGAERILALVTEFIATPKSEECESNQLENAFTFIGGKTFGKAKILTMDFFLKKCLSDQPFCGPVYQPLDVDGDTSQVSAPYYEVGFECVGVVGGRERVALLPYPDTSGTLCDDDVKKKAIRDVVVEQVKIEAERQCQPPRRPAEEF